MNPILAMMKAHNIPLTREKFLELYFAPMGVPEHIHPEIEASFPVEFQEQYPSVDEISGVYTWFCSVCGQTHAENDDADCPASQLERRFRDGTACAPIADRLFLERVGICRYDTKAIAQSCTGRHSAVDELNRLFALQDKRENR
jgi:hypothetical protein